MTKTVAILGTVLTVFCVTAAPAAGQTTGLTPGHLSAWAEIGFQGDFGGSVNSSGIGRLNGVAAEIDSNSWGERYDMALQFRLGVGYDLNDHGQLTASTHWEQAEADQAVVGLVNNLPLEAKFADYQGWGLDVGYRQFAPTNGRVKPFGQVALGFIRVQEISADLVGPNYGATNVPFYSDSWVIQWRFGGGIRSAITDRIGLQLSLDLQYSGVLNDESGLGQLGFERINDAGNKWTIPISGGLYMRF